MSNGIHDFSIAIYLKLRWRTWKLNEFYEIEQTYILLQLIIKFTILYIFSLKNNAGITVWSYSVDCCTRIQGIRFHENQRKFTIFILTYQLLNLHDKVYKSKITRSLAHILQYNVAKNAKKKVNSLKILKYLFLYYDKITYLAARRAPVTQRCAARYGGITMKFNLVSPNYIGHAALSNRRRRRARAFRICSFVPPHRHCANVALVPSLTFFRICI